MCEFISFKIVPTDQGLTLKFSHSLDSHNDIEGSGYEAEWTEDTPDSLTVRVPPDVPEGKSDILREWVLQNYPTRGKLLQIALDSLDWTDHSLYLHGCNLAGVVLPQSVGGWLNLSGCDLAGVVLPQSVGGSLDLRGCTNIPEGQITSMKIAGEIYRKESSNV